MPGVLGLGAVFVPCTQPHEAEVFFAGSAWPESQTVYPGDSAISEEGDSRCESKFRAYDGRDYSASVLSLNFVAPSGGNDDWGSGDRRLVCLTFFIASQGPDGVQPLTSSLKGRGF